MLVDLARYCIKAGDRAGIQSIFTLAEAQRAQSKMNKTSVFAKILVTSAFSASLREHRMLNLQHFLAFHLQVESELLQFISVT